MENIYYLLIIGLVFWYFVYLRKVAEYARSHADKYCQQENLQFLAIARRSSRLRFSKRFGPHWLSQFDIEFSGDGESSYHGIMTLRGYKLDNIEMPPYRVS
ncbi:Protein of unknown function [Colwellia chukchiensis]|uniref:DUF3301 domain-containing protein n=1 Tax=Colwellia chukchiensis TaxID=641665 RepID=A0A1H7K8Q5_9GAMM|nr:DUF3301 domain-containing protein [Colwellia chukchiensis]SEK83132.1 Protein of unknown function [Colwellia chukchiensis]